MIGHKEPKPAKTPQLAAVESEVIGLLAERNFAEAVRAVARYEAQQPVPRGMGVDWTRPSMSQVAGLESIYAATTTDAIKAAAAMMYLWGASSPRRRWLPRAANGDAIAHTLLIGAYRAQQDASWAEAWEKWGIRRPPILQR